MKRGSATSWSGCAATSPVPRFATKRLSVDGQGRVVYRYQRPFRDGTTHVVLEPLDFIARLAALVPRPRLNLARFHGVFAPHFKHRVLMVSCRPRGRVDSDKPRAPMTWFNASSGCLRLI